MGRHVLYPKRLQLIVHLLQVLGVLMKIRGTRGPKVYRLSFLFLLLHLLFLLLLLCVLIGVLISCVVHLLLLVFSFHPLPREWVLFSFSFLYLLLLLLVQASGLSNVLFLFLFYLLCCIDPVLLIHPPARLVVMIGLLPLVREWVGGWVGGCFREERG